MKMIILLWEIFLLVNNKFFPIFERWIKPFRKKEGKNISEDRSWALWADSCYNLAMGEAQMCTIQNSSHCFRFGLPRSCTGKESTCQSRRHRFDPWVRKIPWRRKWQPTPVFLPGESHGQRSLAGDSPWGHKESDTTEVTEHAHTPLLWGLWASLSSSCAKEINNVLLFFSVLFSLPLSNPVWVWFSRGNLKEI